jgi:hypothetical protein
MNEKIQEIDALSIFVYDSVFVSENIIIEVIIVMVAAISGFSLNAKESDSLREVLRISIRNHADELTEGDLNEFGISMLETTAVVLKAKYLNRKSPL